MNEMKSHALVDTTDLLYGFLCEIVSVFKCFLSCKRLKRDSCIFYVITLFPELDLWGKKLKVKLEIES